ncbi:MAG: hypothetical protein E7282_07675 [Lachnospiraceae bacterium]|nr:hypothetical protein [Lachnospiraceae bacterium]
MNENLNMSVSSIVEKNGQKQVYIIFEDNERSAEGKLPDAKIISNNGFTDEEVAALELYISANSEDIFAMAKKVNIMDAFLKS